MIVARNFSGKTVGVFGLARSGISATQALAQAGARVFAWDDNASARVNLSGVMEAAWQEWPWNEVNAVVLSPGVPFTHPMPHAIASHARALGIEVIGDVELFAREIRRDQARPGKAPVIAVTGTNGKSTTTALIGHILSACGFDAQVGGNIGKPVLDLSPPAGRTVYALEISSYQIDLSPGLRPDVGVLTNITPDHLDRHGTLENYAAVKARLLQQTAKDGCVCIGVDDPNASAICTRLSSNGGPQAIPVAIGKVLGSGIFAIDGALYDALGGRAIKVMDLACAEHLPGAHNWQNAALGYAAVRPFVKDAKAVADAIARFPGLPHRIEDVGRAGKVRFINDSKATNADAAERALVCFSDIYWIVGGRPKEGGIASLRPHFSRIRKAYLIGEAADDFARTLSGQVPFQTAGTLAHAVELAFADARASKDRK